MARIKAFNEPPDFAQSLPLFEQAMGYREIVGKLLKEILDARGLVQVPSIQELHNRLCSSDYGFVLRKNSDEYVLPGGRQLFYVTGPVLIRVKTGGTKAHPGDHMTVSLAEGLDWPEEVAKFNHDGELVPRLSPVVAALKANLWRSLVRLQEETGGAWEESDDRWAQSCHFDFAPGFDPSGAAALKPAP
jgi:hypothetical protein